jgi:hypothetical protein
MHSPFTFNPNVHRTSSKYQQQSGGYQQPVYNIGAPPAFGSGFMNHPPPNLFVNHTSFTRSFASVVSCENDLLKRQQISNINKGNNMNSNDCNNSGILGSIFKHFNKPTIPQYPPAATKEFEDFTHMPSTLSANNCHTYSHHQPHYYQQPPPPSQCSMKMPIISGPYFPPHQNTNQNNMATNIMTSLFGYPRPQHHNQQYQQQQGPPKPKNQRWFNRGGFRCRGNNNNNNGKWRNPNSSKFHDHDASLRKNIHEKERTNIERDIHDDSCDFVDVAKDKDVICDINSKKTARNETCSNETTDDSPPFLIYSMEEFPAIASSKIPVIELKSPTPPAKTPVKSDEGFVLFPSSASISTPSFTPKRISLCEKIIKSPQRLFPKPLALKPCLKPSRRRISECSDDFIVFASDCKESEDEDSDSDVETESDDSDDDDDDDIDFDAHEMKDIVEDDGETSDEEEDCDNEDEVDTPEHQLDSGVEEKRVSFTIFEVL